MEPKPAIKSHAVLVKWMGMLDANTAGFVHGGAVMQLCDEAAGLSAVKYSRRREYLTADRPAASSHNCMTAPPWTKPAVLASSMPIHLTSTACDLMAGLGSIAARS